MTTSHLSTAIRSASSSVDVLAATGPDDVIALIAFGAATVLLGVLAIVIGARRRRR
jgi:LPXTG-motif cell wall-anchored protein